MYRHDLLSNSTRSNLFFFFKDTATTEIYPLSLHDALPIFLGVLDRLAEDLGGVRDVRDRRPEPLLRQPRHHVDEAGVDRKSTRLNSSHANISYAVFCLKKKKKTIYILIDATLHICALYVYV